VRRRHGLNGLDVTEAPLLGRHQDDEQVGQNGGRPICGKDVALMGRKPAQGLDLTCIQVVLETNQRQDEGDTV